MLVGIDYGTTRTVVATVDRGNYPVVSFHTEDGDTHDWYPSLIAARGDGRIGLGWRRPRTSTTRTGSCCGRSNGSSPRWGPQAPIALGTGTVTALELLTAFLSAPA